MPSFWLNTTSFLNKIIAKLCLNNCPDPRYGDEYKYKIGNKCYKECTNEAPYHFPCNGISCIDGINKCYEECPLEERPYHVRGEFTCNTLDELSLLGDGYLLYDEKEWINRTDSIIKCPNKYNLYSKTKNTIIVCLNECQDDELGGKYLTPYKTCVKECATDDTSSLAYNKHLDTDEIHKQCYCENLYYLLSDSTL